MGLVTLNSSFFCNAKWDNSQYISYSLKRDVFFFLKRYNKNFSLSFDQFDQYGMKQPNCVAGSATRKPRNTKV